MLKAHGEVACGSAAVNSIILRAFVSSCEVSIIGTKGYTESTRKLRSSWFEGAGDVGQTVLCSANALPDAVCGKGDVAVQSANASSMLLFCVGCVSVVKVDAVWKCITKTVPTVADAQSSAMKLWLVLRRVRSASESSAVQSKSFEQRQVETLWAQVGSFAVWLQSKSFEQRQVETLWAQVGSFAVWLQSKKL